MFDKMFNPNLSVGEIEKIIGDEYDQNNLLGFILMPRYLLENSIDVTLKIFTKVKICNNEVFEHLFHLSNDTQKKCNNSSQCNRHYVTHITLSVDERDCMLDSIENFINGKKYCYNFELEKYVQN